MSKRNPNQIKAERAYEVKRKRVPIGCRLDPEDIERMDRARGDKSRSAIVESLVLDWIERNT